MHTNRDYLCVILSTRGATSQALKLRLLHWTSTSISPHLWTTATYAMDMSMSSDESKVLIINTGGTINMIFSQNGYVPEPYFLTETLHSQHRFHDPLEESLFSHSGSLEGYRRWNSSGKASPTGTTFGSREPSPSRGGSDNALHQSLTLPVRSSRPIGIPEHLAPTAEQVIPRQPVCKKLSEDVYEAHLPTLVTPRSSGPGGNRKRIRYAVLEVRLQLPQIQN